MRAIQILENGGPEVLQFNEVADPVPAAGEALIRIEASGVNFIDTYFREGRYPAKLPYTLGTEAAGEVVAVGEGVTDVKVGDRVERGQRVGMIKFGSRVDVLIPADAVPKVKTGSRVNGGSTILAVLPQPVGGAANAVAAAVS